MPLSTLITFFFFSIGIQSNKEMAEKNKNGNKKQEGEEKGEGKKEEQKKITEVVIKVYMHCEACKFKVSKCLKAFDGVEEVKGDVGNQKVVIKGKDLNPKKILEGIRKKYSKNVELISPKDLKDASKEKKPQPKKEEVLQMKTVVLKMNMHCEGCAEDIKQSIGRMEGIMRVETDRESSKVTIKGAIVDPTRLVESIKKKMGRNYNVEMMKNKQEKESKGKAAADEDKDHKAEQKKKQYGNELDNYDNFVFKYPPQYSLLHIYPNQTFSDDNVFSCSII